VTAPVDIPDAALAVAAAQGDHAAFAALMRRHKSWLYRFVRRYVADRDEAYDVVQDSFVSAWNALRRYDPERPLSIWLRRIALNKCRDRARRNAVRRAAFTLMAFESRGAMPGADQIAAGGEALRRIEAAIAKLPRRLKEPLILTVLEGLSHKEAGALLGINAKAVETRAYRARRQLASQLDRDDIFELAGAAPAQAST
jgi:RNA polymerase sigma factor CnrH